MWQAFANGENLELIYDSVCNFYSAKPIKFSVSRSPERGVECVFCGLFDLDCGEYNYVMSLYSIGPFWHIYCLSGFALSEYERNAGFRKFRELIGLLPDDLKDATNFPYSPSEMLEMLDRAEFYPIEFYLID